MESHPETQSFAKDLSAALKNNLRNVNSGKRYTVIVPSRQKWESLRQKYSGEQIQKVIDFICFYSDCGTMKTSICLTVHLYAKEKQDSQHLNPMRYIAANHVFLGQHCSGHLIQSLESYKTLSGETLEFICETDSSGKERHYIRTVCGEKREITTSDLAATNGVVHIVEDALIPFSVLKLQELIQNKDCAEKLKVTDFINLLKECDLKIEPGQKYAVVLPQDSSFKWWSNYPQFQDEYRRFQVDKEYRCKVARYHIMR
ncbi:unnamed protein product, partial [Trichobilharzia regenti]